MASVRLSPQAGNGTTPFTTQTLLIQGCAAAYLITLQCSCGWWEDYPVDDVPHRVGDPATCYNRAHAETRISVTPCDRAVAAARG